MNPFYSDDWLTVYAGDCRAVLATLEPESVHCVVTSPPYWGLRDYGTATWEGGDESCAHRVPATGSTQNKGNNNREGAPFRERCERCGATRVDNQLGLEPTPAQYVENMVAVFREVRRVLRDDGTLWLNLGDSYNSASQNNHGKGGPIEHRHLAPADGWAGHRPLVPGLKPKDLVGIPWRVAFALQADGWYLRSDIIWAKPNPMPESVTDRPTKSHEYLFLLAKSERYYFDADAVRELANSEGPRGGNLLNDTPKGPNGGKERWRGERALDWAIAGRNIRSVWNIATQPYPGAHFATFPPKLVEPCIKAGSPTLGVVLDPFAGSGTVGLVAQSLSRRAVLIDLNPEYIEQQLKRNAQTPLGLSA